MVFKKLSAQIVCEHNKQYNKNLS